MQYTFEVLNNNTHGNREWLRKKYCNQIKHYLTIAGNYARTFPSGEIFIVVDVTWLKHNIVYGEMLKTRSCDLRYA